MIHEYLLDGANILRETWIGNTLIPLYDNEEQVCGIEYNGTPYFFLKNLQGDVIAIADASGETVVRYSYDAWGACTVLADSYVELAAVNPYRYRSYYFDTDTGLYYLQSRYYDPYTGRFINGDEVIFSCFSYSKNSTNLWEYAYNSPIVFKDGTGYAAIIAITATATVSLSSVLVYLVGIIAVISILAVIFSKDFQRKLKEAITTVWNYAVNTVGYLTTAISEVISAAKRSRKYSGNEVHHIVAQSDSRARQSRELLWKYGLNTSHQYNLVTIKKTLHKHLHTSAYHYGVYLVLKGLESRGKNKTDRKAYVISGLILIGALLKAASKAVQ